MNKFAKGSVAAGAGLVLLLGGAGSLAYWNTSDDLGAGTINAGTLEIDAATGAWSTTIDKWVPGDASTYTTTLTLVAEGDNIEGTIKLDSASIAITEAAADQFEIVLDEGAAATKPSPESLVFDEATETFTFSGPGTYTIPVQLSVEFPYLETEQNDSKRATVDFSKVSFIATQTEAN